MDFVIAFFLWELIGFYAYILREKANYPKFELNRIGQMVFMLGGPLSLLFVFLKTIFNK